MSWPRPRPRELGRDAAGEPVVPVAQYLTEFAARDMSPAGVRSYALEVGWDKATAPSKVDKERVLMIL